MIGLVLPAVALAAAPSPTAAIAKPSANLLTLYSEPGLRGRHAAYRAASFDVERQGFAARSAVSTGLWTLCEGGEVASRCQTIDGQAPELKLSPEIVRPGLNALALYDQPGLKGRQVIYSFPADRPAPFHARSARTWGGPWSLCDQGFKHCQTLDGRSQSLDLVVAAVRPGSSADVPPAVQRDSSPRPTPVAAHPQISRRAAPPAHRAKMVHASVAAPRSSRPGPVHARPSRGDHEHLLTPVRQRLRNQPDHVLRRLHAVHAVRYEPVLHHPRRARLVHEIAERHGRRAHAAHRRLYHRVRLYWGDRDPYLYDADPRDWGPSPGW